MKRLLLLFAIVGVVGYLAGTGELRFVLDSFRPDRKTDIPKEFRGRYALDTTGSGRVVRRIRSINSDVAERVNKLINNQRLEILRASMVMSNDSNGSKSRVGFKVIDQGQNWIAIQSTTRNDVLGYAVQLRLDMDREFVVLSGLGPAKGFQLRFIKDGYDDALIKTLLPVSQK